MKEEIVYLNDLFYKIVNLEKAQRRFIQNELWSKIQMKIERKEELDSILGNYYNVQNN